MERFLNNEIHFNDIKNYIKLNWYHFNNEKTDLRIREIVQQIDDCNSYNGKQLVKEILAKYRVSINNEIWVLHHYPIKVNGRGG